MTHALDVATPEGPGRFLVDPAPEPAAVLVLGHGAGGGVTSADLALLARHLPADGITVVRFEQPWRTAGRRVAVPPPRLDVAWTAALDELGSGTVGVPAPGDVAWVSGGRSAGARVACRTAGRTGVAGVVCLAFPLHPPGRPERSRAPELNAPAVPRLVLQGTRDAFGSADDVRTAAGAGVEVVELPGADHGFRTLTAAAFTPADLRATLLTCTRRFVRAAAGTAGE